MEHNDISSSFSLSGKNSSSNAFLFFAVLYFTENCDTKSARHNPSIILGLCWYKVKILPDSMSVLSSFKSSKTWLGFNNTTRYSGGEVFIKVIHIEEWRKGI